MGRFLIIAAAAVLAAAAPESKLTVAVDHSVLVDLPRPAATVIVGNPSIADVSVEDSDRLAVHGRRFGATNIIAADESGREIAVWRVSVMADESGVLAVHRGAKRTSYHCAGECVRVLSPGDDPEAFSALRDQSDSLTVMGEDAAGQ